MGSAYTWEELRAASVARQFPRPVAGPPGPEAVVATVAACGPIQSQTARSPFLGLAARLPGVTREAVSEAYETSRLVRGSTIRGTVHTSTPDHHALLDATTRVGQRTLWQRMLQPERVTLEELWASLEVYASPAWRTPDELSTHLTGWLASRGEHASVARLDNAAGRYFAFGHGGLLRRPLRGGWDGQGAAGYRTASAVVPDRRVPEDPLLEAVRLHLRCHGPASRHDVAWWSGLGLRRVDELLARLGDALVWRTGPDGREYADLAGAPAARELHGVLLLPEFDAVLCGYDARTRDRFVAPDHNEVLWHRSNGFVLPPLLVDGRVTGFWRIPGSGRQRPLEVVWFPGTRRPRKAELEEPMAAVEAALGVRLSGPTITRYDGSLPSR